MDARLERGATRMTLEVRERNLPAHALTPVWVFTRTASARAIIPIRARAPSSSGHDDIEKTVASSWEMC